MMDVPMPAKDQQDLIRNKGVMILLLLLLMVVTLILTLMMLTDNQ